MHMKVPYLLITCFLISLSVAAQNAREAYVFVMKESEVPIYALVDPDKLKLQTFKVTIEEPWIRSVRIENLRLTKIEEFYAEPTHTRSRRIKESWKAHGGIEIQGDTGPLWVLESEFDLAQRSLEIASEAGIVTEAASATVAVPEATTSGGGGGIMQWWLHGVILLGGLGLAGIVVWRFFLRKSWLTV